MLGSAEVIVLFFILFPVLTLWALVDLLRRPESDWVDSGQNRVVWALVVVLVGLVGPVLYLAMARPKMKALHNGSVVSAGGRI